MPSATPAIGATAARHPRRAVGSRASTNAITNAITKASGSGAMIERRIAYSPWMSGQVRDAAVAASPRASAPSAIVARARRSAQTSAVAQIATTSSQRMSGGPLGPGPPPPILPPISPPPPPSPPPPNNFLGASISACAFSGANIQIAPSSAAPLAPAMSVPRAMSGAMPRAMSGAMSGAMPGRRRPRDTPLHTAHAVSVNTAPNAAAPKVPACVSAVSTKNAIVHAARTRSCRASVAAIVRASPSHAAAMNAIASDCFSKSPTMRSRGADRVVASVAATAAGTALRSPRDHEKVATNRLTATSGCPTLSTKRDAHSVASSTDHPSVSMASFASAASSAKISGTSVHASLPCSSSARACTA